MKNPKKKAELLLGKDTKNPQSNNHNQMKRKQL